MSIDVEGRAQLAAPLDAVTSYICNPDIAPQWLAPVRAVHAITRGQLNSGSQFDVVVDLPLRQRGFIVNVTEWTPSRRLVLQCDEGLRVTFTWAPAAAGTDLAIRYEQRLGTRSGLLRPLIAARVRRLVSASLMTLEQHFRPNP